MKPLLTPIALTMVVAASISAQTAKRQKLPEPGARAQQSQPDLKRLRAVELVEQTALEAPLWSNRTAAIEVLADAADLLWDQPSHRGPKWLIKAWTLIDQTPDSPGNPSLKDFFSTSQKTGLRTSVLSVARRRDPVLAEQFLSQLAENKLDEGTARGAFDDRTARSEQLLRMAQQAVEANPDLAMNLGERSLADGISYSFQNLLTSLRRRNAGLANRLFDTALARFVAGVPDPSEAEVLTGYLFQSGFTFSVNSSGQTILVVNPTQQSLPVVALSEPERAKNLLVAVYRSLLAAPLNLDTPESKQRAQQVMVLANRLTGHYYTFAPEFAQPAQGFLAQLRQQLQSNGEGEVTKVPIRVAADVGARTRKLTAEQIYDERLTSLEEKAEKELNPVARKLAYIEAALAAKPEDYQRGKRIAEKCPDDELKADAVAFVLYRAALFFVEKDEMETALEIVPQILDAPRRAVVQIAAAQRLLTTKPETRQFSLDSQRAFQLLSEIERDLAKREPSANSAKILLGRIALLAKLDKAQALASLAHTIQMINKLESFDLRDGSAPDLGLGISAVSGATVARPRSGYDFRSAIEPVVISDFEYVSAMVERLTTKEINGVGRLELAKLYLQTPVPPAKKELAGLVHK